MNLTMLRSGNQVFAHAECVTGKAHVLAVAGVESAHFGAKSAANGSSFMLLRCAF